VTLHEHLVGQVRFWMVMLLAAAVATASASL